jgi:hypothetical protein
MRLGEGGQRSGRVAVGRPSAAWPVGVGVPAGGARDRPRDPEPGHRRRPGAALRSESFAVTIILYAFLAGIVATPYVHWQKRRLTTPAIGSASARGE